MTSNWKEAADASHYKMLIAELETQLRERPYRDGASRIAKLKAENERLRAFVAAFDIYIEAAGYSGVVPIKPIQAARQALESGE